MNKRVKIKSIFFCICVILNVSCFDDKKNKSTSIEEIIPVETSIKQSTTEVKEENPPIDDSDDTGVLQFAEDPNIDTSVSYTLKYVTNKYEISMEDKRVPGNYVLSSFDLPELIHKLTFFTRDNDLYYFKGWDKKPGDVITEDTMISALWTKVIKCPEPILNPPPGSSVNPETVISVECDVDFPIEMYRGRDKWEKEYINGNSFKINDMPKFILSVSFPGYEKYKTEISVEYNMESYSALFNTEFGKVDLSFPKDKKFIYGETIILPPPIKRQDYYFKGWNNGIKTYSAGIPYEIKKDEEFTAVFEKIPLKPGTPDGYVYVNGGTVKGGSQNSIGNEPGVFSDINKVYEIEPFYMSKHLVTRRQYKEIMTGQSIKAMTRYSISWEDYVLDGDPSYFAVRRDKYKPNPGEDEWLTPEISMTRNDAMYFCNLLSIKEGFEPVYGFDFEHIELSIVNKEAQTNSMKKLLYVYEDKSKNGYRLPTDEEWEWAVRGGDPNDICWNYAYSGIDADFTLPEKHVLYDYSEKNLQFETEYQERMLNNLEYVAWYGNKGVFNEDVKVVHQVGLKLPNRLGLYDMCGNTYEMVDTLGFYNILRGGSCSSPTRKEMLVTFRNVCNPTFIGGVGFRIVRRAE